jgi:Dolichyl-phosphate-mannose-protein mannosyltransferase
VSRRRRPVATLPKAPAQAIPPKAIIPKTGIKPLVLASLVVGMLIAQWSLATLSLVQENPTIDEVIHLPAGISYWQTGDFRMYPHNPPLVKLIAALPVLAAEPRMSELYERPWWKAANKAGFAHEFALWNADRYFNLLTRGRLVMPWFGVLGGLLVFLWSRRLYGDWGGLLSLALWSFCPNILAHTRLITTDVGATVAGFGATFAFWHYIKRPSWGRAALAGALLGVAQLTKFSLLLLYGLWPLIWLINMAFGGWPGWRSIGRAAIHGLFIVGLSVVVIDAGYGFAKLGRPLGSFDFTSDALTNDRIPPVVARRSEKEQAPPLHDALLQYRVNRVKNTWLGAVPSPLPEAYFIGFDEQKLEAEGIPPKSGLYADDPRVAVVEKEEVRGYPVYLNGELSSTSWWYYYLAALVYKVPEGTWALVVGGLLCLILSRDSRASWADELSLLVIPLVLLLVMSFATNIALGLRYVLPIAPYIFVSTGKLARWAQTRSRPKLAAGAIAVCLAANIAAIASIHPSYLAYFNWASGGPDRGSEHLIDSNLDWGQDLVGLKRWVDQKARGERIGIAYFGQINPAIFGLAEGITPVGPQADSKRMAEVLNWFLPPALPGTLQPDASTYTLKGPEPGLYAVSASLMRGLPWRVYVPERFDPVSAYREAFSYFASLEPIGNIGHSILLYRITPEDARRLAKLWESTRP